MVWYGLNVLKWRMWLIRGGEVTGRTISCVVIVSGA